MNICKSLVFMGLDLNIKKRQGGILSTRMLSSILCPQSPKGTERYSHFSLKIIITIYIYKKKKKKKTTPQTSVRRHCLTPVIRRPCYRASTHEAKYLKASKARLLTFFSWLNDSMQLCVYGPVKLILHRASVRK